MALTKVTGHVIKSDTNITSHNINSSGIITAISFDGNVSGVAVTFTGDSTIGSLGITTNLNVGGISTFSNNVHVGTGITFETNGQATFSGITTSRGYEVNGYSDGAATYNYVKVGRIKIYDNGSNNHIFNGYAAPLYIQGSHLKLLGNDILLYNTASSRYYFRGQNLGAASLYWAGSNNHGVKLATTEQGISVTGNATISGNLTVDGVLTYQDVTNIDSIGIVTARDHINIVTDNKKLRIGAGQDLQIYHSTFNYIESHNDSEIHINANTGGSVENMAKFKPNGAVELYHNNQKKLETKGYGIDITGGFIASGGSIVNDGGNIKFGTGSDLQIFHDNSNNINVIQCHNGRTLHIDKDNGSENMAKFIPDGAVELYHNNVKKIETTTDGVTVTGAVRATGVNFPVGSTHLTFGHGGSFGELDNLTGNLRIKSGSINLANRFGNHNFINCAASSSVDLYYDAANHSTPKLKTSATGITVDGEVAASQDYPTIRPTLDFNFVAEKKLDPRITYQRTGPASYYDEFGKVVLVGDNVPRFDHDPYTRESKGLLIEQSSTNEWRNSESLHGSTYVTNGYTLPNGLTTPAGGSTAVKILPGLTRIWWSAGSGGFSVTSGDYWTMSWWAYSTIQSVDFGNSDYYYLANTTISQDKTVPAGQWKRCFRTVQFNASGSCQIRFMPYNMTLYTDTNNEVFCWGFQFEKTQFPTSYIPTTGSIATRGLDITTIEEDEFTEFYNPDEWTMITDTNVDNSRSLVASPSEANSINFEGDNNTKKFMTRYVTSLTDNQGYVDVIGNMSGTSYFDLVGGGTGNYNMKTAFAAKVNDVAASFNGGTVQTDTSVTMLEGGSIMNIGQNPKQCHIKRIMYYPKRLPNSQLVTLTS